jgi:hypothetical protein
MIKVVITTRRPVKTIPYYTRPQTVNDVLEIQQAEGKFLRETRNLSEDGLIFTYEGVWNTIEDYWQSGKIPSEYRYQCQHHILCSGKSEGYFMAYNDFYKPFIIKYGVDDELRLMMI